MKRTGDASIVDFRSVVDAVALPLMFRAPRSSGMQASVSAASAPLRRRCDRLRTPEEDKRKELVRYP